MSSPTATNADAGIDPAASVDENVSTVDTEPIVMVDAPGPDSSAASPVADAAPTTTLSPDNSGATVMAAAPPAEGPRWSIFTPLAVMAAFFGEYAVGVWYWLRCRLGGETPASASAEADMVSLALHPDDQADIGACLQWGANAQPLTSSRVPPSTPGHRVARRPIRRALLFGLNYKGSSAALGGCINDVVSMSKLLQELGYDQIVVLTDDTVMRPTRSNMLKSLQWLTKDAQAGDQLYLHYSGHGAYVRDQGGREEADGMDETLVPLDYQSAGEIRDDTLHDLLVKRLPAGVKLTCSMDCCHSGTALDLGYTYFHDGRPVQRAADASRYHARQVMSISGCADHQTSADVWDARQRRSYGAMSHALETVLRRHRRGRHVQITAKALMLEVNRELRHETQTPRISLSAPADIATTMWSL